VTSFPECAEAWLLVGAAAYQLGDAAGCVAACDRAIMLDPNLVRAAVHLCCVYRVCCA